MLLIPQQIVSTIRLRSISRLSKIHQSVLSSLIVSRKMAPPAPKRHKSASGAAMEVKGEDKKTVTDSIPSVTPNFQTQIIDARKKCAASVALFKFNKKRVRVLTETEAILDDHNGVLYWMIRDQRVEDNWALLYAQRMALKQGKPLHVAFVIPPTYYDQTIRHYKFMLGGLEEVAQQCAKFRISFHLLHGKPDTEISKLIKDLKIGGVVVDFLPLKVPTKWVNDLVADVGNEVPVCQVDAHNLVPCWEASPKCEYGARTIRRKIHDQLNGFLTEFPPVVVHPHTAKAKSEPIDWTTALDNVEVDRNAEDVEWAKPGAEAGIRELENFILKRLQNFSTQRNDPNKNALSNLSPWIHFGHLSMQRCILMVKTHRNRAKESVDAYIEEAVIRRELADNYCFYNENYDNIKGAYEWAQKTLRDHSKDKREYLYTEDELENAKTHDDLWNATQIQVRKEGKMHGFLRMYWAKKILEWTSSPEEGHRIALLFNDKFNLDGTDPNGYVGVSWSICGVHDQGWREREVFGKIRYMNYKGCQRKFDVPAFVRKYGAVSHLKNHQSLVAKKKK